jgi:hypothetical protein
MDAFIELLSQLSPGHLFEDPPRVESSLYVDLLFVLGSAFALGLLANYRPELFFPANPLNARILKRYGSALAWLAGFGVLAMALRYSGAPFFAKRIWTVLDVAALIVLAGHFVHYRLTGYAEDRAAHEEEARRRRFHTGTPGPTRRRRRRR